MVFDFKFKDASGEYKAIGVGAGRTREEAFEEWEKKHAPDGIAEPGEYMSQALDGSAEEWETFTLDVEGIIVPT